MMQKSDRVRALVKALDDQGVIHLREAVSLLGVSEMTVRRDVAANPDLFTYLGGHIVNAAKLPASSAYVLETEEEHFAQAKAQACAHAAGLIAANDTVFVDCGTTLATIGRYIPRELNVTMICYSLNVAEAVRRMDNIRLILLGGVYVPSSDSFTGNESLEALRHIGINKALISAGGVDPVRGVSCWNFHEVPIKQAAMESAVERHLVVDSSKFGQVRAVRFAQIGDFDSVISEAGQKLRGAR
jgi:DeoR family transcriptional regulator, deoxyribose operon repressor